MSILREVNLRGFHDKLKEKLDNADKKYGHGDSWYSDYSEEECRKNMMEHIAKGDPLDVAAYCFFMWVQGWSTNEKD